MPPKLVIFDCDGVLVDTEPAQTVLLASMLGDQGLVLTGEECRRRYSGMTMEGVQADVEKRLARPLGAHWIAEVIERTVALFSHAVPVVPHVEWLIQLVKRSGLAICVASSGKPEKMRTTLTTSGLAHYFGSHIFDATMVARGKPAPDLFLHAAKEMGFEPADCVVIEDSLPGVRAASAAGMRVVGYAGDPHTDGRALAAAGAEIVTDMREVPALIGLSPGYSPADS